MHLKSITLCPQDYPTREHYPFSLDLFQQIERMSLSRG